MSAWEIYWPASSRHQGQDPLTVNHTGAEIADNGEAIGALEREFIPRNNSFKNFIFTTGVKIKLCSAQAGFLLKVSGGEKN